MWNKRHDLPPMTDDQKFQFVFVIPTCVTLLIILVVHALVPTA